MSSLTSWHLWIVPYEHECTSMSLRPCFQFLTTENFIFRKIPVTTCTFYFDLSFFFWSWYLFIFIRFPSIPLPLPLALPCRCRCRSCSIVALLCLLLRAAARGTVMRLAGLCRVPWENVSCRRCRAVLACRPAEGGSSAQLCPTHQSCPCSDARELQPGSHLPSLPPPPILLTAFLPPCPLFLSFLILLLLLTFCLRSLILGPVCQGHYIVRVVYNTDLFITVSAQVISE